MSIGVLSIEKLLGTLMITLQKGMAKLTVTGIERVLPHDDEELLTTRESLWINNYDSIQFGANTRR